MIAQIRSLVKGHRGRASVGIAAALALVLVAGVATFIVLSMGTSGPASATDVDPVPVLVPGNPDCASLGLVEVVKVQPVTDGTFGPITLSNVNSTFDWTSTISIDVVIVKGGPNANKYVYVPASFGDDGLHSPENPNNGRFYGLSHVSFCGPGEPPDTPTPTPTPPEGTPTPTPTPPENTPLPHPLKDTPTPTP